MRTVIVPHLIDVVTGRLLPDRTVAIDGHRLVDVVAAGYARLKLIVAQTGWPGLAE